MQGVQNGQGRRGGNDGRRAQGMASSAGELRENRGAGVRRHVRKSAFAFRGNGLLQRRKGGLQRCHPGGARAWTRGGSEADRGAIGARQGSFSEPIHLIREASRTRRRSTRRLAGPGKMGTLELKESPHAPGVSPVRIHYREAGAGRPVVFLHGGWGYGYYPIDRQMEEFGARFQFLIPDRTGYGKSSRVTGAAPMDFHRRAAEEMSGFLAGLGIERCTLWGHSDGAVIAAMMGLAKPKRYERIVLEAFHFYKRKKGSTGFFERLAVDARVLGEGTRKRLAADHGKAHWKEVVQRNAEVWVRIGKSSRREYENLFD